tara:strand:- start:53 stop:226 length:174 start_codon:yes stop_codon:yes gene_type:complete
MAGNAMFKKLKKLFSGISGIKLPVFLEQAQAGQEYSYSIAGHKGYQDQYGYDICGNN